MAESREVPNVTRPARDVVVDGAATGDYARLVLAADREQFYAAYRSDIRPTTDDRPFFFHTTKLQHQLDVAFGKSMLFGNGLSALLTLLGISMVLVALFVIGPLALAGRGHARPPGWLAWLVYFGALGAGFMLIEVSVLQRFVLLLGHPVYSLAVTLFSLLLGTGLGAAWSRRLDVASLRRSGAIGILTIAVMGVAFIFVSPTVVTWAIPFARGPRDPDADRDANPERAGSSDGRLGVGGERRVVGSGRHSGHIHRDELGLPGHVAHGVGHLRGRTGGMAGGDATSAHAIV